MCHVLGRFGQLSFAVHPAFQGYTLHLGDVRGPSGARYQGFAPPHMARDALRGWWSSLPSAARASWARRYAPDLNALLRDLAVHVARTGAPEGAVVVALQVWEAAWRAPLTWDALTDP